MTTNVDGLLLCWKLYLSAGQLKPLKNQNTKYILLLNSVMSTGAADKRNKG
jgi:hypothetical protein